MPDLKSPPHNRPSESEYALSFAGYVSLVPEHDIVSVLAEQLPLLSKVAAAVPVDKETFRYAREKWSIREVLGHMGDAERVFGYRAFSIGRGSQAPLPGFDENEFVATARFDRHNLAALVDELIDLRQTNLALLRSFDDSAWGRSGIANNSAISVRALVYIMAGHIRHHLNVLRDRYGVKLV